ncbi:MAG: extracellular solute-binding protein [Lachnospiraceae bacterium]
MKRKNVLKMVVSTALITSMVVSMTACGGKQTTKVDADGNQVEFSILSGISALSSGYEENEVLKSLQEENGITINWDCMSDSLSEQVNIRIAGGDLPDAFQGVGFSNYELTRYGTDGTFIDLTQYITEETMPNLSKILKENPDILSAITMSDGGIYGLPSAEKMGTAGIGSETDYSIYTIPQFSMINKAWLDDLGLAMPTTLDELHDVLVAFKENDMSAKYYGNDAGTTIPMSTGYDQWCWGQNIFYAGFGFTNWINDVCNDLVLKEDGTVEFVSATDNYRAALTYFHDWFADGLMDNEMFSQSDTQYIAKCSQGYVGVGTWWYIEELMGEYASDYEFLPVLDGPSGTSNVTIRTGGGTNSGNLSITSACESPETLLKFYDSWYQADVVMQLQYGPIGTYFSEQDENGVWLSITDAESKEKFGKSAGELKSENEVYGPKLILSDYYNTTFKMEDRAIERLTDLQEYWMQFVSSDVTYPVDCVFTEEELEIIDQYRTDFENTVSENEGLWIKNGGPTDEEWNNYLTVLKESCGMDKLLSVYQEAYNRYENVSE